MSEPDSLRRERLILVLATIALNIGAVVLFANVSWSDWRTGVALNLVDNALLLGWARWRKDRLLVQLIVFGLVLGFTELAADAWLVDTTRTLDYSIGGGPQLWRSPAWMPFAWEIVAVQFGVLGTLLMQRFGALGLALTGLIGAINIPFYEEMALRTRWWSYTGCPMLGHTPWYIIVGELGIALAIALLARRVQRAGWSACVPAGLAGGAAIFACYALGWWITGQHG